MTDKLLPVPDFSAPNLDDPRVDALVQIAQRWADMTRLAQTTQEWVDQAKQRGSAATETKATEPGEPFDEWSAGYWCGWHDAKEKQANS